MSDEFEFELTSEQWEALKNLRNAASPPTPMDRFTVDSLIAAGLAAISGDVPVITSEGRKVLVRGSSQLLLDLAA
jgi:hypothetical protein